MRWTDPTAGNGWRCRSSNVRSWLYADIGGGRIDVHFWGESGRAERTAQCRLLTQMRHCGKWLRPPHFSDQSSLFDLQNQVQRRGTTNSHRDRAGFAVAQLST